MTLEDMYKQTADYTDENIGVSPYDSDIVDKFKAAINYAYQKICKEKWFPETSENVELDSGLQFDTSAFSKIYNGIIGVKDNNGYEITWEKVRGGTKVKCSYDGTTATVVYRYIPDKMDELTDEPVFSDAEVGHLLMCYYAAYDYFIIEEEPERAEQWYARWAEGFAAITQSKGEPQEAEEYW